MGKSLLFPEVYFARWRELVGSGMTGVRAWETVENEMIETTGLCRYVSYNSFLHGRKKEERLAKSDVIILRRDV